MCDRARHEFREQPTGISCRASAGHLQSSLALNLRGPSAVLLSLPQIFRLEAPHDNGKLEALEKEVGVRATGQNPSLGCEELCQGCMTTMPLKRFASNSRDV